ncbi:hypothetical protein DCC85_03900 [Paenibacillus sp. CAA11]|uniref:S8 family serine peptidase n=1 Tax=Paenibacillus sp. CAA11 TaxID=1532905 RepID=UPI000D3720E1|nr:S8 family serine peptidase [Paenibacillus sp. CAA11]AWB43450.1 hypothetical protein DCC85_03900 [Paenibacillus sp. CAA11]
MMKQAVKVAIIDDGISRGICRSQGIVVNCYELVDRQVRRLEEDADISSLSHGTICTLILASFTKHMEIYSLNIIPQASRTTSVYDLCIALEWCLENDIKIVNMSLGTTYFADYFILESIIQQLYMNGTIIVAACNNDNVLTSPASMPNVIGVKCDSQDVLKEGEFFYNEKDIRNIQITSCCIYSPLEGLPIEICNSYAAPYITALVINYTYEGLDSYEQMIEKLKEASTNHPILGSYSYDLKSIGSSNDPDVPHIGLWNGCESEHDHLMDKICSIFQGAGYNGVVISDACSDHYNFFKLENYWTPPVVDVIQICEMIKRVSQPDILLIELAVGNPKYEPLMKEKLIDKLVVLMDSREYTDTASPLSASFPNEDIIMVDLAGLKDDQEIAEQIYAQILNIYA